AVSDERRKGRRRWLRSLPAEDRVAEIDRVAGSPLDGVDVLWGAGAAGDWLIAGALASGVLAVTPPAGAWGGLLLDGVSALLESDDSPVGMVSGLQRALRLSDQERELITERARRMARAELHPSRVAHDLMLAYQLAMPRPGGSARSEVTPGQ